jgi:outer membrane receptor for ferrienterochelin and colicins
MFQNRKWHNYKPNFDRKILSAWAISYRINKLFLDVDYTGNVYGPMRLRLLDLDHGNIPQLGVFKTFNLRSINSRILKSMLELNLLNWTQRKSFYYRSGKRSI